MPRMTMQSKYRSGAISSPSLDALTALRIQSQPVTTELNTSSSIKVSLPSDSFTLRRNFSFNRLASRHIHPVS